jgi:hypothetical protein
MIREQEGTEQSHQLVTVGVRIGAEGDFFRGTDLREPEPNEPDREVQRMVAQDRPQREQNPPPRSVPRDGQLENGTEQAEQPRAKETRRLDWPHGYAVSL